MANRNTHVLVRALHQAHTEALRGRSARKLKALRRAVCNIAAAAREREVAARLVKDGAIALLVEIVTDVLRFGGALTSGGGGSRRQCLRCGNARRGGLNMDSVERIVVVAVDALEVLARNGRLGTDDPAAVHVSWTLAHLLLHPYTSCHPALQEASARAFLAGLKGPIALAIAARGKLMSGPEFALVRRMVSLVMHGPSRISSICASIFAVVAVDLDAAIVFHRLGADKALSRLLLASARECSIDSAVAALAAFAAHGERVFQTPWLEQPMVNMISGLLTDPQTALGISLLRLSRIPRNDSSVVQNLRTQLAFILASNYFHPESTVQYESLMVERDVRVNEEEKCLGPHDDVQDEQELSNHATDVATTRKALRKKVNGIIALLTPSMEVVGSLRSPVPLVPTWTGDVASVSKEALEAAILELVQFIQFHESHDGCAQAVRFLTRIVCGSVSLQTFACGKNIIRIFARYLGGVQAQCCVDGSCGLLQAVYSSLSFLCVHKGSLANESDIQSHVLPSVVDSLSHRDPAISRAAFMCFGTLSRLYVEMGPLDVVNKIQPFLSRILEMRSNPGNTYESHVQRRASRAFCSLMMMKSHQNIMVRHDGLRVCARLLSSEDAVLVVNAIRAIESVGFHSSDTTRNKLLSTYPYHIVQELSTSQYQEIRKDALLALISFSTTDSVYGIETNLGDIRSYVLRNCRRQQINLTSKISIADVVVSRPPSAECSSPSSDGQPSSKDNSIGPSIA